MNLLYISKVYIKRNIVSKENEKKISEKDNFDKNAIIQIIQFFSLKWSTINKKTYKFTDSSNFKTNSFHKLSKALIFNLFNKEKITF